MRPPGVPTWPRVTANAPLIDCYEDYQAESQTSLPPPSTMQSQLCNEEKSQSLTRKPSKCGSVLTMPGTDLIVSPGQESLKDRSNYFPK